MRVSPLLAILFLATAACAKSAPPPAVPPSNTPTGELPAAPLPIAGAYQAPHEIRMVCEEGEDGWCDAEVMDTMTVRDAGIDRIEVAIELVQTNAHTCTFEGTLTRDTSAPGPRRWTHSSNQEDEGPCAVTLTDGESALELTSEGCRYYCGARAYLEASFPRQ